MQNWEHLVKYETWITQTENKGGIAGVARMLTKYGEEGWEIVSIVPMPPPVNGITALMIVFKRPME